MRGDSREEIGPVLAVLSLAQIGELEQINPFKNARVFDVQQEEELAALRQLCASGMCPVEASMYMNYGLFII